MIKDIEEKSKTKFSIEVEFSFSFKEKKIKSKKYLQLRRKCDNINVAAVEKTAMNLAPWSSG